MAAEQIVDATIFLNEIDLLMLRCNYMKKSGLVTKHVVAQGNFTFSGKPWKPILVDLLSEVKVDFRELIEPIEIDLSSLQKPFDREHFLRESLLEYVKKKYHPCKIIFSDLDEVPSLEQIKLFHESNSGEYCFEMETSYRKINMISIRNTPWTSGMFLRSDSPTLANAGRHTNRPILKAKIPGSHFSYCFSNMSDYLLKVESFAHYDMFENPQVKSDKFIEFVNRFRVDHLGCMTRKGWGLLKNLDSPSDLQLFGKELMPDLWENSKAPNITSRIWASAKVSAYFNNTRLPYLFARGGRRLDKARKHQFFEHYFGSKQEKSFRTRVVFNLVIIYEIYCSLVEGYRRAKNSKKN